MTNEYFCAKQNKMLTPEFVESEACLNPSMQHDGAQTVPCKQLVVFEEAILHEQCDSFHYNSGNNTKCICKMNHDGLHVARSDGKIIVWASQVRLKM